MNSPALEISNNIPSPIEEAECQKNNDLKHWSKLSNEKRENPVSLSATPPKIDSLTVEMSPQAIAIQTSMQKSSCQQNGMPTRKKMRLDEEEYESLEMACNLASEMNDDCDAFGKHVAAQLRQMTRMQKFTAQRLISEICFRGQIHHLTLSTNVVNTPQHQQQPSQQPNHLQTALFTTRPPHIPGSMYGNIMLHQQTMRPSTIMPPLPQHPYQNFLHAQPDQPAPPLE